MSDLKRTQLYGVHVAAGATMVDFGGWEMPTRPKRFHILSSLRARPKGARSRA